MRKLIPLIILLTIVGINLWSQNVLDCIPVVKEVGNQINQVVVSANNGSAIMVWQDNRAGNYNIYAQRIDNAGYMQWLDHEKGKIVVSGPSNKVNLSAVSDNDGGAIITWQDDRAGNNDIYAQWISSDGNVMYGWPVTGTLICDDTSEQSPPLMVGDEDGGAFVTWSDNRGGDYDIFIRHILPGGLLDTNTNGKRIQLLAESLNQVNPAVCTDGNHGAIIAYEQYSGPGDYDIFAQRISDAGLNMWDDGGIPACIAANNQKNPRLVNDAVGSAIIVWEDYVNFTWDIYAQRVANNTIQWTANGVAIMAIALDQIHPVIVPAGEFGAIIVWEHYLSATDSNIYAQKIFGETSGTLQWLATGIPVSSLHDSFQKNPQAVTDTFGGVIIAYETAENYATNGYDIYGQRLNQDGQYVIAGQPGGYVICTWDTDQTLPMLAYSISATNNAIYAWRDKRNESAPDIYDIYTLGMEPAITYTLNVNSVPVTQDIFRDATDTGVQTNYSFVTEDLNSLLGNYTLQTAPAGFHWVPANAEVIAANFTLANNYTYTINFVLEADVPPVVYTYTVASHDVTNPGGADLNSEIWYNGVFTGVHTGYVFGAPGNLPMLAGTYTVVRPNYASWVPESFVITDINQNYSTDFLGIRYILTVTSTPVAQGIFKNSGPTGMLTNSTLFDSNVANLVGTYTLEVAPSGYHWVPVSYNVVAGDFTAANNYTYTINFELVEDTLPVELSSFTATLNAQYFVNLTWISQTETGLLGYRVYRSETLNQGSAISLTPVLIPATNTSTTQIYNFLDTEVEGGNVYYYWLESVDMAQTTFYGPVSVTVDSPTPPVLPEYTMMGNAYPNPFNISSSTTIDVIVKAGEAGKVNIYNVLGQNVRSFIVREGLNPLIWDGRDNRGNHCSSGVYFYKLQTPSMNQTKKLVIIK